MKRNFYYRVHKGLEFVLDLSQKNTAHMLQHC